MKNFRISVIIFYLLVTSSASLVFAEPDGINKQWNVSFSVFPLESANWSEILYAPNGNPEEGTEELYFNPHEKSEYLSYKGVSPLRFFRKRLSDDGKVFYESIAELTLSANNTKLILLCSPVSKDQKDGPYQIQFMADTPENFPNESLVFYNTTKATFYGILGKEKITLPPGASEPIDITSFYKNPAPIGLVVNEGGKLHKVLVNKFRFSPDRRTLIILRNPKSPKSMRIRTQRLTEYTGVRTLLDDSGA